MTFMQMAGIDACLCSTVRLPERPPYFTFLVPNANENTEGTLRCLPRFYLDRMASPVIFPAAARGAKRVWRTVRRGKRSPRSDAERDVSLHRRRCRTYPASWRSISAGRGPPDASV